MLIHLNKNTEQIIYLAYVNLCHSERRHAKSTDIFVDPELVTLTHNPRKHQSKVWWGYHLIPLEDSYLVLLISPGVSLLMYHRPSYMFVFLCLCVCLSVYTDVNLIYTHTSGMKSLK